MEVNLILSANTNKCSNALVNDLSVYSASPNSRANFGISLFVRQAGVLNYALTDYTNANFWNIPISSGITYETQEDLGHDKAKETRRKHEGEEE